MWEDQEEDGVIGKEESEKPITKEKSKRRMTISIRLQSRNRRNEEIEVSEGLTRVVQNPEIYGRYKTT